MNVGDFDLIIESIKGDYMGIHEISDAASIIHDAVLDDATVIIGTAVNDTIKDGSIQITVIATGFELRNNSSLNVTTFGTSQNTSFDGDISKKMPLKMPIRIGHLSFVNCF